MSRLFIIILSVIVILMPVSAHTDAGVDQKRQTLSLFKQYKAALKAQNNEDALKLAEQMYVLTPKVYGKISKTHATVTFNLAQMSELLHHRGDAARYYQEHIDILDALQVPKDEIYVMKSGLLAQAYLAINELDEATKYGRQALIIAKKLKLDDKLLAEYNLLLGIYYYRTYGKGKLAKKYLNKAYNLFSITYGEAHIKTALAMFWQAKLDMGVKKNARAAKRFEQVLDIYKTVLPAGDDTILQVHAFLVNIYERMGKKEKSTEHCIAVATERPLDFDREIDPLYKVLPIYPQSRRDGYIIAEFTVDKFGQVKDIKTLEGENVKIFEKNAHKALSQFRYAPRIKDGKLVKTEGVKHKVRFTFD